MVIIVINTCNKKVLNIPFVCIKLVIVKIKALKQYTIIVYKIFLNGTMVIDSSNLSVNAMYFLHSYHISFLFVMQDDHENVHSICD